MKARVPRLLLTSDAVGGVWTYSLAVAAALGARGSHVTLGLVGPGPSAAQRAACATAGIRLVTLEGPLDWMATSDDALDVTRASILQAAHDVGADVIQTHAPALNPRGTATPVLGVVHSCLATWWAAVHPGEPRPAQFAWHAEASAAGLARATRVVAPSRGFARALVDVYGSAAHGVGVIHNGVEPRARPPSHTMRDLVVASGRVWDDGKNLRSLDAVAPRIAWPVWIAGSLQAPSGEDVHLDACRALGVLAPAAWDDLVHDRPIFVSPSLYEPFGLAILEAAAAACPLVVADTPTMRELWDGAALFADPRDPESFARAIQSLIEDESRRRQVAAAAQTRSHAYTLDRTVTSLLHAQTSIAKTRAMAAAS